MRSTRFHVIATMILVIAAISAEPSLADFSAQDVIQLSNQLRALPLVVEALPESLARNNLLILKSQSKQLASFACPRVLMFEGNLVVAYTGHKMTFEQAGLSVDQGRRLVTEDFVDRYGHPKPTTFSVWNSKGDIKKNLSALGQQCSRALSAGAM